MPEIPDDLKYSEACGDIESVESVSGLITPVAGTVRQLAALVNAGAYRDPEGE